MLVIPIVVINVKSEFIGVQGATWVTILYAVLFLKMWSYIQVNHWCRCSITILGHKRVRHQSIYRQASLIKDKNLFTAQSPASLSTEERRREKLLSEGQTPKPVTWPDNLNVVDIYYFWVSPTLCYELNFPRSSRIRTTFLIRRALEVIVGINLAMAIVQQYITPSVVNSLMSFATMDLNKASERLLKLALPNHLLWLVLFYLIFHSYLNTLGELLQFADRDFYHDWWNASNLAKFWKLWNLPVHRWEGTYRRMFSKMLTNWQMVCPTFVQTSGLCGELEDHRHAGCLRHLCLLPRVFNIDTAETLQSLGLPRHVGPGSALSCVAICGESAGPEVWQCIRVDLPDIGYKDSQTFLSQIFYYCVFRPAAGSDDVLP